MFYYSRVENVSLKLDDISQKENSIKLSLQTVDRRLGKVEEHVKHMSQAFDTVIQKLDTLFPQASNSVTSNQPSESGNTNQTFDGPSVAGSAYLDYFKQDNDTDRSEARLRPFTDYNKPKRPPYMRARSLGSGPQDAGIVKGLPHAATSIPYQSHRENKLPHKTKSGKPGKYGIRPGSIKLNVSGRDMKLSPVIDSGSTAEIDMAGCSPIQPLGIHIPSEESLQPPPAIKDSKSENSGSSSRYQSMPINSIVTPTRVEYTSITDDIDTSFIDYQTPLGSPSSSGRFSFGLDVDVGLYTRRFPVTSTVEEKLHSAEDSHHTQLEGVIQRRMRQISLTEHDSIVDLAKHVISVETEETKYPEEPQVHSDEEDLHVSHGTHTLCVNWNENLKAYKSEPFLPQTDGVELPLDCPDALPDQESLLTHNPADVSTNDSKWKQAKRSTRGKRLRTASESTAKS